MSALPTGTVTFLFTDIEGSTKVAQRYPTLWESLRERHHAILQSAMDAHNGYVFQIIGDAFCVAFHTARDGLNAALDAQRRLQNENWGEAAIEIRMGIHTGEAEKRENDYRGYLTLARVQRIMSAGHGGQVLLSDTTAALIRNQLPEGVRLRDMKENLFKGWTTPEHLWQVVATDLKQDFPSLSTLTVIPNNLPVPLTSFVGREQEIADVRHLLATKRLVTLTGSGGTGKTRLSLQVAADLLGVFKHGVWFVELAPLTDPELIPLTILSAMGASQQPGRSPIEILKDFLREKVVLILIDNCEHLIEASANMANILLNSAADLKILASSREALGVQGEALYPVPSLSLPDPNHLPAVEQLSQFEAVQLFIDRALLVQPHFAITNENAPSVAQICHRLDGIPLAVELAAARLRSLSAGQIASRLDDRFRLLTGGARTTILRQQTLRAMINWSYDLLAKSEQTLLQRLAVFSGGCTLEAAEFVCSDGDSGGILPEDVLDLITHLVDKSLVNLKEADNLVRYSMLETTRQYASEKLLEAEASQQIRNRHVDFFSRFAVKIEPKLYGGEQVACLNEMEKDIDNFRGALEWSLEEGDPESGMHLANALWRFWVMRGYWVEGYEWLKKALLKKDSVSFALRAKALHRAGDLASRNRDFVMADALLTESLTLCRELGDEEGIALSLYSSARRMSNIQDKRAREYFEESLTIYRKRKDKWGTAFVLDQLSFTIMESEPAYARILREECLTLFRELNDHWDLMRALHNYGELARFEGDYALAKALYEEARVLGQKLGVAKYDLANQLCGLGYCYLRQGNQERAAGCFKESFALQKEQGITTSLIAQCVAGLGGVAAAKGQSVRAVQLLGAAKSVIAAFEANGDYLELVDLAEYDRDLAIARIQLDEATFNAAWEAGWQMSLEEVVPYAVEEF